MGLTRVELVTSRLSGVRSNHLSYRPITTIEDGIWKIERSNLQKNIVCTATEENLLQSAVSCPVRLAAHRGLLRKEVIQPHLPIRLPCYDLAPITRLTLGAAPLAVGLTTSGTPGFRGLTGGVYKARERIHRGLLIRDY